MSVRQILHNLRAQMPELIEAARILPAVLKGVAAAGRGRHAADARRDSRRRAAARGAATGPPAARAVILGAAALLGGIVWLALGRTAWPGWTLTGAGVAWLLIVYRLF